MTYYINHDRTDYTSIFVFIFVDSSRRTTCPVESKDSHTEADPLGTHQWVKTVWDGLYPWTNKLPWQQTDLRNF